MHSSPKLPALPDVPPGTDEGASLVLRPLKEVIEVREGRRGSPLDRFVSVRDLVDWGIVRVEQVVEQ